MKTVFEREGKYGFLIEQEGESIRVTMTGADFAIDTITGDVDTLMQYFVAFAASNHVAWSICYHLEELR